MAYETDERLKSYLDTNQLQREGMCLAVMALDRRFSNVRPRHPRGGPDGGRDIEATFSGQQLAFGAVGFMNQANDSDQSKAKIASKFESDFISPLKPKITPTVFIFFTNINFTIGEKSDLIKCAQNKGISTCEIFDRERIRIALDSPDGLAARFQFLNIPLSDAEQATFFARWGTDIQSVITTGFQDIRKTLDQMLFIHEANRVLHSLHIAFKLDREYEAAEIGHLRAFCYTHLKAIKLNIFSLIFGSWDGLDRNFDGRDSADQVRGRQPGLAYGLRRASWEQHVDFDVEAQAADIEQSEDGDGKEKWTIVNEGTASADGSTDLIAISYQHDQFIRFAPRLSLLDLDEASIMPVMNKSFAEKLDSIEVYANGYKLLSAKRADISIDDSELPFEMPIELTDEEAKDKWVRIRPSYLASHFSFDFSSRVPQRIFTSRFIAEDNPGGR